MRTPKMPWSMVPLISHNVSDWTWSWDVTEPYSHPNPQDLEMASGSESDGASPNKAFGISECFARTVTRALDLGLVSKAHHFWVNLPSWGIHEICLRWFLGFRDDISGDGFGGIRVWRCQSEQFNHNPRWWVSFFTMSPQWVAILESGELLVSKKQYICWISGACRQDVYFGLNIGTGQSERKVSILFSFSQIQGTLFPLPRETPRVYYEYTGGETREEPWGQMDVPGHQVKVQLNFENLG